MSAARACRTARGAAGNFGEQIGLSDAWAANVIRSVGNCGEAFERNLGSNTLLAILFVEPAERADLDPIGQDPQEQPTRQMGGRDPAQVVAPLQTKPLHVEIDETGNGVIERRDDVRSGRRTRQSLADDAR